MHTLLKEHEVTPRQSEIMKHFCQYLGRSVPDKFQILPPNYVAVLHHWRVLHLISASLQVERCMFWKNFFTGPFFQKPQSDQEEDTASMEGMHPNECQEVELPMAVDSHFHPDRLSEKTSIPWAKDITKLLYAGPVEPNHLVRLGGSVAVFCDPSTYPTISQLNVLPGNIVVALGLHPHHARKSRRLLDEAVERLQRLLRSERVTAFGEIGIDHSDPESEWAYQSELLRRLTPLVKQEHVLEIHCRGMKDECGTEAYLLLLHHLKKRISRMQRINLHYFTGYPYLLERWLEQFPETWFGFTSMVKNFDRNHRDSSNLVKEYRLLLETDAPYFTLEGQPLSSPNQIYRTAEIVAELRQVSADHILSVTAKNAKTLYRIKD
ncbi:uncharacterized metal-dependent hydrolase HI_0454-like [Dreissena polymorpha]|uniref:Uncharacterized protein n=1 Tax=Dreissena polymorpha TaxID=45954 RepID=A0A9D4RKC8_DREPO|nr:uncharacterized metal-dependent hydrolase HI_0454-like [Dreissena polymorpha]KAH3871574.1 hypothetical protein DPMN_034779 [Dreissena polymorpha]